MKIESRRKSAWIVLLAVCCAVACAGKVTRENYDKVSTGMSPKDVEAILGPGTEQASSSVAIPTPPVAMPSGMSAAVPASVSGKVMTWQSGGKMITVTFVNDKVAAKAQVGL